MSVKGRSLDALIREAFRRVSGGVRPGLEATRSLLDELGQPHQALPCIHVAGTNGKGSVCAMLEGLFLEAGFVTGLYTSPHLVRLNERFRVAGHDVADDALHDALECVLDADARRSRREHRRPATFFELTTCVAFLLFERAGVNMAIVETGMGGEWDATNVIVPLCSAITQVERDHMEFLGDTIGQIAGEKAGIIKAGRPVVTGAIKPEAMEVIRDRAVLAGSSLIEAEKQVVISGVRVREDGQSALVESGDGSYGRIRLPLGGEWQLANMAVALSVFETVAGMIGLPCDKRLVARGLARTRWRGRLEWIPGNPPMLLDGAHNEAGAKALTRELRKRFRGRKIGLICGMLADKDVPAFARAFSGVPARCWTVAPSGGRALPAEDCAGHFRAAGVEALARASLKEALEEARAWARETGAVLAVAGSLYLIGDMLRDE